MIRDAAPIGARSIKNGQCPHYPRAALGPEPHVAIRSYRRKIDAKSNMWAIHAPFGFARKSMRINYSIRDEYLRFRSKFDLLLRCDNRQIGIRPRRIEMAGLDHS
ncbi:MAG: hypothetical protein M0Z28_02490, partial [Rhodospirillales bacterium]|nr:hypothetical protein [Rhodospirillales bacterium]